MDLTIENFRGIHRRTTIKLSPKITLIAGPTGSGKTSVIQALQALVTGETVPLRTPDGKELKKKDAKLLVHDTEKSARAALSWTGGETEIKWPACKLTGPEYGASVYAAGLSPPATIPSKDLTGILGILPTREDFLTEMSSIPPEFQAPEEQIWSMIESKGWDGAYNHAAECGRELKRDWQKLAGEEWGSTKSAAPPNYSGQPLEELEMSLRTAEKLYEHAVKSVALGERERADLQALAGEADSLANVIGQQTQSINDVQAKLSKAQSLLSDLPKILNEQKTYPCWNCGQPGMFSGDHLVQPPAKTDESENAAIRLRISQQQDTNRKLQDELDAVKSGLHLTRSRHQQALDAQKKLQQVVLDVEQPSLTPGEARAEVELCRARISAHHAKTEADEIQDGIAINGYIQAILEPDGLRKQVLSSKLASFNELLATICETADWPIVSLDESLDVRYGKFPYALISVGEKLAANAALQIAIAKLDGSKIIVIDHAESLDNRLRNGLVTVLDNIPIPSVVGCNYSKESDVPDLGDIGVSYWIHDGALKLAGQNGGTCIKWTFKKTDISTARPNKLIPTFAKTASNAELMLQ